MSALRISARSLQHGSLEATVDAGGSSLDMVASYLSNAPADLTWELRALLEGAERVTCRWQEEPGEYRWVMERQGDHLRVRILWFKETFSRQGDEEGETLLEGGCDLLRFATEWRDELRSLLNELGDAGYREQWHYEFPRRDVCRLEELIQQRRQERHRR
jgi:hypothetical protein